MEETEQLGGDDDTIVIPDSKVEIIDVEAFVAQALTTFDPLKAKIDELKESVSNTVFDLTTTKGNKAARSLRAKLKAIPGALEKAYTDWNQPRLKAAEAMRAKRDELTALIPSIVAPLNAQIEEDEKRRDAERLEKERAETARVGAIRLKITNISSLVITQVNNSSEDLAKAIEYLEQSEIKQETFQEFTEEAKQVLATAIAGLKQIHAGALKREENEREVERLRKEAEERMEQERKDREERERIDRETREKIEADAKKAAEAAQKLADEAEANRQKEIADAKRVAEEHQAELKRQADAFEEERTTSSSIGAIQSKVVGATKITSSADLVQILQELTQWMAPKVREDLALQITGALDEAIVAVTGMIERAKAAEAIEEAKAAEEAKDKQEAEDKAAQEAQAASVPVAAPETEEAPNATVDEPQAAATGQSLEDALLEANEEAASQQLTPEELAVQTAHETGMTARAPTHVRRQWDTGGGAARQTVQNNEPEPELKAAVSQVIAAQRPTDWIILDTLATNFGVKHSEALDWLQDIDMFDLQKKVEEL